MVQLPKGYDSLVVLGPTASGKTTLGVELAVRLNGEILSADSRQVYRGLDIGSGKDLETYQHAVRPVACHLVDLVGLPEEFSLFDYVSAFNSALRGVLANHSVPIVVGGSGLYLQAIIDRYEFPILDNESEMADRLSHLDLEELQSKYLDLSPNPHNTTDLQDKQRLTQAILIAHQKQNSGEMLQAYPLKPFMLGIATEPGVLHKQIRRRLEERLEQGLLDEVSGLLEAGIKPARLQQLGLEYRYVTDFLLGAIRNRNDLVQKLSSAINQFAKKQRTWFRKMEREGHRIHWLKAPSPDAAIHLLQNESS